MEQFVSDPEELDPVAEAEVANEMQRMSDLFDNLCFVRHQAGQKEYGKYTFLGNDVIRMMVEELADTANYCRYQAIKLMILQQRLTEQFEGNGEEQMEELGINTFRGAGRAWEDANKSE